jgi:hypothetical protein
MRMTGVGVGGGVALKVLEFEAFNVVEQVVEPGHRAKQAEWSKRSSWTPRRQDGAYRYGAMKTRV